MAACEQGWAAFDCVDNGTIVNNLEVGGREKKSDGRGENLDSKAYLNETYVSDMW